jgi:hypothetical protein
LRLNQGLLHEIVIIVRSNHWAKIIEILKTVSREHIQ